MPNVRSTRSTNHRQELAARRAIGRYRSVITISPVDPLFPDRPNDEFRRKLDELRAVCDKEHFRRIDAVEDAAYNLADEAIENGIRFGAKATAAHAKH